MNFYKTWKAWQDKKDTLRKGQEQDRFAVGSVIQAQKSRIEELERTLALRDQTIRDMARQLAASATHTRELTTFFARARACAGVTLVELLVVMAIAAIVTGITAVSMRGIAVRNSREGAALNVINLLRATRMSAINDGRGALITWDGEALTATSFKCVAAWHLEGDLRGARQMDAVAHDDGHPLSVDEGAVGLCYRLNYDEVSRAYEPGWDQWLEAPAFPVFDQRDAFAFEGWFRLDRPRTDGRPTVLAERVGSWSLSVGPGGALVASLEAENGPLTATGGWLEPGRWTLVGLSYGPGGLDLTVDGPVASHNDPGGPIHKGGPMGLGKGFMGLVDEPRLLGGSFRAWQRPKGAQVWISDPLGLAWDAQGFLDLGRHGGGLVEIALGDPYQAARLATPLTIGDTEARLSGASPFPHTGGTLLLGGQPVDYAGGSGDRLLGLTGVAQDYPAGEELQWARLIEVRQNGQPTRTQ